MARVFGRVWLVGLMVLGLVVSLLGVAPPAAVGEHGDEEDIDFAPMYSACVGAATESAGFEDTVDIGAEDAINCLAHYGITTGRSETMYAPGESVLRWQMALFLARAAMAAGIVLENPAEDQGFTDIGAVSEEAQNAINGLADAGIMPGVTQTTFSPNSSVNRGSMAMLLDAFLAQATPGTGAFGEATNKYSDVKADNFAVFTDVNTVSLNTYNAIYRIYELGVTKGVGDHQFNPAGLVTRGQMASFITRAFAHTVARPAGISIQGEEDMVLGTSNVGLIVSVRDVNFQPVVDATVDVFSSSDPDNAFGEDGACDSANVGRVSSVGQTACEVDLGDSSTDATGDVSELSLQVTDASLTVWAWTGDRGDKFDSDDTTSAQLDVGFSKAASQTLVTDDLVDGQEKSKFGETVTVTIQIADEDDKAVADKGQRITVRQATTVGDNTTSSANSMTTNADGKIELEFTQADPNTNTANTATVTLTLSNPPAGLPLQDAGGNAFSTKTYIWSDEAAVPTTLKMSSRNTFGEASDEGGGAGSSVTATLTDQFGDPVRGKRISFLSDSLCTTARDETECSVILGVGSTPPAGITVGEEDGKRTLTGTGRYTRTTGRDGRANLSYTYDSNDSTIETIWATYPFAGTEGVRGVADSTDPRPAGDEDDQTLLTSDRIYQYWVEDPGDVPFTGRILVKDPDNNQLVVAAEEKLMLVKYDANDQFLDFDGPTVMAEFEKPLAENADPAAVHLKVTNYEDEAGKVSTFTLQEEWPSLNHPDGAEAGAIARYGASIAADDGTIVIGAPRETHVAQMGTCRDSLSSCSETDDVTTANAGMVYIYPNGMNTASANVVAITPPTVMANAHFGHDVDIAGDTIVVGTREGLKKAYVYVRGENGAWPTTTNVILEPLSPVDAIFQYGEGVAISSDGSTIAVAAPTTSGSNGAVLVYEKPNTGWAADNDHTDANTYSLNIGEGWNNQRTVAISGDGSTIASGSCAYHTATEVCRGWIYVYVKPAGGWVDATDAEHANGHARFRDRGEQKNLSEFGKYLALSDDGSTLVASNHFQSRANVPGSVRVYVKPDDGWATLHADHGMSVEATAGFDLTVSSPRNKDVFGQYVAITADGSEIAASRHHRQEGDFRGSVVTFQRPTTGWATDSSPDEEFLGPRVNAHLGWQTTYDKSDGDLYSGLREEGTVEDNSRARLLTVYQITR